MKATQGIERYRSSKKLTAKEEREYREKKEKERKEELERQAAESKANAASAKGKSAKTGSQKASPAKDAKAPSPSGKKESASLVAKKGATPSPQKEKSRGVPAEVAIEVVAAEEVETVEVAEEDLEAEISQEMAQDSVVTSQIVKEDYSPVNSSREHLIVEYSPLIKFIAQKIAARLPANIELDDLISSGVIGLMDAIDKYDASRDNKFKTYAEFRIRGAILDELRAQDWVPRSVREKAKQLERAFQRIEQQKGRHATDEEVCLELGVTREEYFDLLNQVRSVSLLSYDDVASFSKTDKKALHGVGEANSKSPTPYSEVNSAAIKQVVAKAIQELPEKQRLVLSLYYYEDLNLKEIGKILDVTESRVSQLHTQAVLRLKAKLKNHWDEFVSVFS